MGRKPALHTMNIKHAVVYAPGRAIFGTDLLDLTINAVEAGINLTGHWIRNVRPCDESAVWIEGGCEDKRYLLTGKLDN